MSHHGSLRPRFTKLTAAGLWASTGKKEERGMLEKWKRERKQGWRENRKQWGGEERSKCRKTQTAGEREKSLWHIVVWCVVVSLQYSGTSRLPSSDVKMELELDGSKLHKYTNPHLYKQAWYWCGGPHRHPARVTERSGEVRKLVGVHFESHYMSGVSSMWLENILHGNPSKK